MVGDLAARFPAVPQGSWPDPPHEGVVIPIRSNRSHQTAGFLVAGLSARLKFDEAYRNFLDLATAQIALAITNARAHEEERQRAEALMEIDRAKTAFFSNVSHEFRTPLTLMLGPLESVLAAPNAIDVEAREQIETAHRNSLRLLKLVNSLLDFARIEAGRVKASYVPVDLAELTRDISSNFRAALEAAGLEFDVDCPPLPRPVYVDRDMWEKIVLNLLSNAFKFTLEGRVRVRVEARGDEAVLTVADTGTGIPATELPHIFERFHRVENARGRTYEGTGIGLALIQELTRLHGGTITAVSRVGEGSVFSVAIPFGSEHLPEGHLAAEPREDSSMAMRARAFTGEAETWVAKKRLARPSETLAEIGAETLPAVAAQTGPRPRILLADDNADMREHLTRILAARYEVISVGNGIDALQATRDQQPDLILSDVMMPGLDGFGLLREVRGDANLRDIPLILLSARAGEEARMEGIHAGADDYLTKPFSANEMAARVETTLKLQRIRREAGRQLETLLNQAPLGVYLVDADFRLRLVNPAARAMFGDIPDLIGRDLSEVIHILWHKSYADEIVAHFHHTLETGEPYATPERIETRLDRGVTEYYKWRIDRITLPDGRFGVVCYFTDIATIVRAREEIAHSEERFRAFVTANSDVVYRMNADWTEMLRLDGKDFIADPEGPSGSWFEKYIHPDDRQSVTAAMERAIETKTPFALEHRVVRVDGSLGWTFSRAVPLLDSAGEIAEWVGTARDVTERKRADEAFALLTALAEQQRRLYHTILSSTPDLVYVFDLNHRFTYANDALLAMWGKTWAEAVGKNCLELGYEPWHAEMHDREIEQVIATKQSIRGEVPFTGTHGRRIYEYIFVPVFGNDGEVESIAGTTRDVTDRKLAEEEIQRANKDLEQFAYTASHDLQEPLRTVKIYTQLLAARCADKMDSKSLELFEFVRGGADRMEMLVRDLLAYTRTAMVEKPSTATDATEALKISIMNLAATISETGARITFDPLPAVMVHATHLQQIFQNLAGNAIKYRRTDFPPQVHISAKMDKGFWRFCVSDNGIGIPAEYKEQIFGVFKRLHGDDSSGTGIGLAICQRIAERYQGRIWVESEPGQGSKFYFTIPV